MCIIFIMDITEPIYPQICIHTRDIFHSISPRTNAIDIQFHPPQSYIKVSFNNSPRTTVTNTQNVQLIKRKSLSTHLIKGKEEQTSIRTKQTDTGKEIARWRISPIHRARLDPLHLPRVPTLRHNVSLCHGRLSSLLSLERFNSAGSHSSLTHTENLVCGILDFGNSSNWMARSWMQLVQQRFARKTSEKDASIGGGRETRSGSRVQFFSIHPFSPSLFMIFFLFFFRFPTILGVAVARCNLGWVVKILTLCGPRQFIRVLASRSFRG